MKNTLFCLRKGVYVYVVINVNRFEYGVYNLANSTTKCVGGCTAEIIQCEGR